MLKKKLIVVLCCIVGTAVTQDEQSMWSYIHRYLPEKSLIRVRCCQEKCIFNIWIFKSQACRSCDYINSELKGMDADQQPDYSYGAKGFLGGLLTFLAHRNKDEKLRDSIWTLLSDSTDTTKWEEYEHVRSAARDIEKQRKERNV